MYEAGNPTVDGGLWNCAVLLDGRQFCNVLFMPSEQAARERAEMIADALNRASR